jgi:hypothetical protein
VCAAGTRLFAILQVFLEIGNLFLAKAPKADFLVPFKKLPVAAAEAASAVLA